MGKKIKIVQPKDVRERMEKRLCVEISMGNRDEMVAHRLALSLYQGATCLPQERKDMKESIQLCLEECNELQFRMAMDLLLGKEEAERLVSILGIRLEGPYSEAVFRTPFRSSNIRDYIDRMVIPTIYRWIHGTGCPVDVLTYLTNGDIQISEDYDISNRLALELRDRNPVIVEAVQQIVFASNDHDQRNRSGNLRPVSQEIISGIIRSGHEGLIRHVKEILMDKNQPLELREMIVTSADEGSLLTFVGFLELIYEEALYRSPIISRAMDQWLWFGFGAFEPQMAEWILRHCLMLLAEPKRCYHMLECGDMLTMHLALWALALKDVREIPMILRDMVRSEKPFQEIVGMNFVSNVFHEYLEFPFTCELLEKTVTETALKKTYDETMERLAWIVPNLIPVNLENALPKTSWERQHLYSLLERTLQLIGTEEHVFCGKPFPWSVCRLNSELVVEAMLRMTYVTKDRSMIRSLARNIECFTPKQRGFFYEYLLDPMHWREDDFLLQKHQKDRSLSNRQLIQAKLKLVQQTLKEKGEAIRRM